MLTLVLLALVTTACLSLLAWLLSVVLKDSSIADVFWGLHFVSIAWVLLLATETSTTIQQINVILVTIWGLRLALHIGRRKVGKPEDWRYAKWRDEWGAWFQLRSLGQNFLFQGLLATIISLSTIVIANSRADSALTWWQLLGVVVWLIGFSFEVVGDHQLSRFLKSNPPKGSIMTSGLWRYTRHPNYFGEITQWWGLWILCIGLGYWQLAVLSPLLITFLIVFVSGVPMLEKKYQSNPAFVAYAARTSKLIPLPPKKENT